MRKTMMRAVARRTLAAVGWLSVVAVGTSCNSFLAPQPTDTLTTTNFYHTAADALAADNAIYGQLQYLYLYFFYSDVATDDIIATANFGSDGHQLADYTFDKTLWWFDNQWTNSYQTIARANIVLQKVPAIQMDTGERTRILGEARFLRALCYFNLVRWFGDVPLTTLPITTPQGAQLPRTPSAQVYTQIINDLDTAAIFLPVSYSGADAGRATQGAALALLGKVYLTQGLWSQAATTLGQVITSNTYSLNPRWKTSFSIEAEYTNPEDIFQINYASPTQASGVVGSIVTLFGLPSGFPGGDAYGLMQVIPSYVNSFSATDSRGNHGTIMLSPYTDSAGRVATWTVPNGAAYDKYLDESNQQNMYARAWEQQGNGWVVLRYADVLLMYAEAVNNGGTPIGAMTRDQALNAVRMRGDANATQLLGLDAATFQDSMRVERRKEFSLEGQRWFDLTRWNVLDSTMRVKQAEIITYYPTETTVHGVISSLFPIPLVEIQTDPKLTQNPGY